MKKLMYIILILSCGFTKLTLGADVYEGYGTWDPSSVARVALALRDNPRAQTEFLEMAAGSEPTTMRTNGTHEIEDPTGYALTPVRGEEQIRLTLKDITDQTTNAYNLQNIFYIDLNDFNFSTPAASKVFDYFNTNTLHNLRVIHLRGAQGVSNLIERLFGSDRPKDKFVSLFRIEADQSDITSHDLNKMFNYFSNCSLFIRDMRQISSRHGITAAFLSIEVRNISGNIEPANDWRKGKKTTKSNFAILYRSKEASAAGPFIMSIEG